MLMTDYALNKEEKKSEARKSGLSGANPECPGNPDTPGKSPDSPGFQHTRILRENLWTLRAFITPVKEQNSHRFSI
jgi:hypothetical protein